MVHGHCMALGPLHDEHHAELSMGMHTELRRAASRFLRVRAVSAAACKRTCSLSLRRSVAFQWFFTAFSVRPVMTLAMSAHLHAPQEV